MHLVWNSRLRLAIGRFGLLRQGLAPPRVPQGRCLIQLNRSAVCPGPPLSITIGRFAIVCNLHRLPTMCVSDGIHSEHAPNYTQRLLSDFRKLQKDPPTGVNASPNTENLYEWTGIIFGPEETPW